MDDEMTANKDILQALVNDLGCQADAPTITELLAMLIQEQRRTNDVVQNLAESIAQLAHSMIEPMEEETVLRDPHAGL